MPSFNKITIVGHLGRDPEVRYLPDGTAVCSFSVATSEKSKRGGESHDVTTWFKVNVWGKQGEACNQYLAKGALAYIEGKLSQEEYTDKEGNKRTTLAVRANDVQFLDRKPQGEAEPRTQQSFTTDASGRVQSPPNDDDDSSIPF
jgi:single-strand DNA-binding protein